MANHHYGYGWLDFENGVPHPGVDYNDAADAVGLPVRCVADGKVVGVSPSDTDLGNSVVVEHVYRGEKVYSEYGHLDAISVPTAKARLWKPGLHDLGEVWYGNGKEQ